MMTINQDGISLIELVITMAISLLIATLSFDIFTTHYKKYQVQTTVLDAQQNAGNGIDMMLRELRMAGYDPTGTAFNGKTLLLDGISPKRIIEAAEKKIRFLTDTNGDGNFDDDNEDVTYELRKGEATLRRKTGAGGQPLAENIDLLLITYFDKEGKVLPAPVSDTNGIRVIEIYIRSRTERADPDFRFENGFRKKEIRSSVYLRNL
ncbi:MAG: hypothetical protein AAB090_07740 [Nitrospirota bacterium]